MLFLFILHGACYFIGYIILHIYFIMLYDVVLFVYTESKGEISIPSVYISASVKRESLLVIIWNSLSLVYTLDISSKEE